MRIVNKTKFIRSNVILAILIINKTNGIERIPATIDENTPCNIPSSKTILLSWLLLIPIVPNVPNSFFLRSILREIVFTTLTTPIKVTITIKP